MEATEEQLKRKKSCWALPLPPSQGGMFYCTLKSLLCLGAHVGVSLVNSVCPQSDILPFISQAWCHLNNMSHKDRYMRAEACLLEREGHLQPWVHLRSIPLTWPLLGLTCSPQKHGYLGHRPASDHSISLSGCQEERVQINGADTKSHSPPSHQSTQ
jgi:hypothetical protein